MLFDASQRVVVYWPDSADSVTVVSYESTVSAANTTAAANAKANGATPRVRINWTHSDISQIPAGPVSHPDAREDLPAWIDAVEAS